MAVTLLTACGGNSKQNPDGAGGAAAGGQTAAGSPTAGSSTAGSSSAGTTGDAGGEGAKDPCYGGCTDHSPRPTPLPPPLCPDTEPGDMQACAQNGLRCGYGNSPDPQCRSIYECQGGKWGRDVTLEQRYSCDPLPADYCPAKPQHEKACVIATPGLGCHYDELTCTCRAREAAPGKPGTWICFGPPANHDCPAAAPNLGDGCANNGAACNYDTDGCNAAPNSSLFCFEGAWEQGEGYSCAL